MKNKLLKILVIIFLIPLLVGHLEISANEKKSFYNKNGVLIYEDDYEIFKVLSYEEQDINYLSQDQIERLRKINVCYSFLNTYYIETEYKMVDNKTYEVIERYISKKEFELKSIDQEQGSTTFAIQRPGIATSTFDYKTMTVAGAFDNSKGTNGCFTIRVTVTWNTNPDFYDQDIIGIKYDNLDIILNQIRVETDTSITYRDDFYLIFWHNLYLYEDYNIVDEQEIVRGFYLGNNIEYTNTYYDVEDRYGLAVTFDFPKIPIPVYEGNEDEDGYGYHIDSMRIALEANFYANKAISAAKFTAFYIHNTGNLELDLDLSNISFFPGTKVLNIFNIISFDRYFKEDELDIMFSNLSNNDNVGTC